MDVLPRAGRYCLSAAIFASGLMQIVNAGFVRLVPKLPAWVPAPEICAVALGGALVLVGVAWLVAASCPPDAETKSAA